MSVLIVVGKGSAQSSIDRMAERVVQELERYRVQFHVVHQRGRVGDLAGEVENFLKLYSPEALVSVGYSVSSFVTRQFSGVTTPFVAALPDIPGTTSSIFDSAVRKLEEIASSADLLIVRDEPSRSIVEYLVSSTSGRVCILSDLAPVQALISEQRRRPAKNHRVLISSHDFRFISDTVYMLQRIQGVEVRLQHWQLSADSPANIEGASEDFEWADTVLCEWAGRNAVWYSQHIQDHQRLLVRLHGFEGSSTWIKDLRVENVDKILTVSAFYKQSLSLERSWPLEKIEVIGNSINYASFRREKLPEAEFHVGMLGYTPLLKRPQVALDVLRLLLEKDSRFVLHLRGESPWNHSWLWRNNVREADSYRQIYTLVGQDPVLRSHVVFEAPGANVESWLTKIGWILSLSERETFHLAAAEGMASGAVPVFLQRKGVEDIFTDRWLFASPQEIADYIDSTVRKNRWLQESERVYRYAQRFDYQRYSRRWREVILGD